MINVIKREKILAGASVWYSDVDNIERDLEKAWHEINRLDWREMSRVSFARNVAHCFPALWQVHPFREGNTRTIVMLIAFFVEWHGFFFDQELLAASAGYTRNAFVLASLDQNSEYEPLEKFLLDAICEEPIAYSEDTLEEAEESKQFEKYKKYVTDYIPVAHEYVEKN